MPLNVAIVGLKGHQGTILDGISQLDDVRLAAVCDDDAAALAGVREWRCADEQTHTYADWQEMLEREQIDILGEAGVDSERHKIVIAALQRGIHCLCEKPLAASLPDLADVQTAVDNAGDVHLSMLLTMRFEPTYRLVKSVVEAGDIGEVCLASFQKSYRLGNRPQWQKSRETFSGIIPFIGIHALDCLRWTTGREFTEVFGHCSNAGHPDIGDMEDQATVLAALDNGASAVARLDYCRPAAAPTHGDDRIRIAGNRGVIEAIGCGRQITLITSEEGPRELQAPEAIQGQFANFVGAIRGECDCDVPAADCLRMTEVVLKARAAAQRGIPFPV